ncbi:MULTISPECIES: hypothetical protein [unclassified Streptomyces]|uniref:hypothetical protein n=1 Tax=unclassified Streptomyces TaxID=2593676 RepID=UPI0023670F8C|nr:MULTISPECIES: hypothetical protein [unclassified Streptomyces]MDF3142530.1 hypothetical protein [Streptomyces sp. T21Q-yed]WDF39726.1 hypothetical protein PBV52_24465 [Streptomyces sp. T12]
MVTSAHEGMHRIFQERPEILTPVFKVLGIELPEKAAAYAITTDATETKPMARHIDTALRIDPSDGDPFLLAVEAQERRDPKKASSWPYYVAYLRAKYNLPVLLLVVCRDRATAKWATGPFDCGTRGWIAQRTCPLVVGPDNLPVITDERTAGEKPALAAFSALTHANSPGISAILDAMGRALLGMDEKAAEYFYQFLDVTLGKTPAGDKWRNIMGFVNYFPGRGHLMERTYLEGQAKGEAMGILRVLEVRGLPVSDEVRQRITTCTDLGLLNEWLDRAGTVTHAEELFTEAPETPVSAPEQA